MIALPWFVLTTTGSPEKTGLVALAEMLPLVVLKVLGGPIIDRVGARRVAITCDWASLGVVGAIPFLHEAGLLSFPGFLGLVAVAGALRGPGDAAKYAMTPTLAATAGVPMERVTGLSSTVERTASMLGAALAGGLVAVIGPANALIVDAASFGVSALLLAWAVPAAPEPVASDEDADPAPYVEQLRAGWRFLRSDRVLVGITVMVALTNLLDIAWAAVLVPVWGSGQRRCRGGRCPVRDVRRRLRARVAGGGGVRRPTAALRTYLVCFLVTGLPRFVIMAVDTPLWGVLAFAVVAGFASGFLNPILGAVIYERVPEPLMGRVTSLSTACCFALMPLGGLVGGFLVGGVGLSAALLVCGAAYFVVTMLPAVDPRWRDIERKPHPTDPTDPTDPPGAPSYAVTNQD